MGIEELYHSVREEVKDPINAEIFGTIPSWIEGSLYRNGPGKFEFGETKYKHWFDGMALLHRFKIINGEVKYQNRFLESDTYIKNKNANRIVVSEFGTATYADPCKNLFQRFFSYFTQGEYTDNTLVNVFPIGDSLYTATETNFLNKIDSETLERLDKTDLTKIVSVNMATAHPHFDDDGTYHNLGMIHGKNTSYAIIKIKPPKTKNEIFCETAEVVAKVPAQWKMSPIYSHSFSMTENFYIIIEQPLVVNSLKILTAKLRGAAFNTAMEWYPDHHTKFHIINKKTGEKISEEVSYQSDAFFTFHTVNAYESEGYIVLDIVALDKEIDVAKLINGSVSLETLQMASNDDDEEIFKAHSRPRRYVLPIQYENSNQGVNLVQIPGSKCEATLQDGKDSTNTKVKFVMKCKHEMITDLVMEFPQINYKKCNGKKYRYIYGAHFVSFREADGLVKIDIDTKEILRWEEKNVVPSEPVFLASPNAIEEDDGALLSVGLTLGDERCAYLLIINAKDMKEIGRAKVHVQIGAGIHGIFIQKK